jgi:hypothetical protein
MVALTALAPQQFQALVPSRDFYSRLPHLPRGTMMRHFPLDRHRTAGTSNPQLLFMLALLNLQADHETSAAKHTYG